MKTKFRITTKVSQGSYFLLTLALLLFLFSIPGGLASAQEAEKITAEAANGGQTNLWDVIKMGGIWMIPLFALSIGMIAFIVNNFMILQRKKLTADYLMPELLQKLAARDIDGALNICGQTPCLFTSILEGGLARITTDEILPANIRMGIDETGEAKVATLIKPVNYLTNIASVSPMVGLLGTVSGMIKAFQGLSLGAGANAEQMAANISEALVTTAAGLVIAIPAMIFYFYFKNNFAQTLSSINAEIGRLLNALETGAVMYVPGDNEAYNSQHMNTQQLNVEG
jgi:biopolymer transport protein ExbB